MNKADRINKLMLQQLNFRPDVSDAMKKYVIHLIRHHNYSIKQIKSHIKGVLV